MAEEIADPDAAAGAEIVSLRAARAERAEAKERYDDTENQMLADAVVNFVTGEYLRHCRKALHARRSAMTSLALTALQLGLETQTAAESVATYLAELGHSELLFDDGGSAAGEDGPADIPS